MKSNHSSMTNNMLIDRQILSFVIFNKSRVVHPLLMKYTGSHPAILKQRDNRRCFSSAAEMAQCWDEISILREADVDSGALQPHSEALTHPTVSSTLHSRLPLSPPSWVMLIQERRASGQLQPKQNEPARPPSSTGYRGC